MVQIRILITNVQQTAFVGRAKLHRILQDHLGEVNHPLHNENTAIRRGLGEPTKFQTDNGDITVTSYDSPLLLWAAPCHYIFLTLLYAVSFESNRSPYYTPRASIHKVVRCLTVKSREVSKPWDWVSKWSYGSEIWQASQRRSCRDACQISEPLEKSKSDSRGFDTSRDLAVKRRPAGSKW